MSRGIAAICSAQAIAHALQQVQAVDILGSSLQLARAHCDKQRHTARVSGNAYHDVSIDGELNEELSRSLSLAKKRDSSSRAGFRNVEVGFLLREGPFLAWFDGSQDFPHVHVI